MKHKLFLVCTLVWVTSISGSIVLAASSSPAWTVEVFNIDDTLQVYVNDKLVSKFSFRQEGTVQINQYLRAGRNTVKLELYNLQGTPYAYGYRIKYGNNIVHQARCGQVNSTGSSTPCGSASAPSGLVFKQSHEIEYTPRTINLELVRSQNFVDTRGGVRGRLPIEMQCIIGSLFVVDSEGNSFSPPASARGRKIAETLELPDRNNLSNISSIPEGSYRGFIRTDGERWRLELSGDHLQRGNIQIHLGNRPTESEGCILLGTKALACETQNSAAAIKALKEELEAIEQPITLRIRSELRPPDVKIPFPLEGGSRPGRTR